MGFVSLLFFLAIALLELLAGGYKRSLLLTTLILALGLNAMLAKTASGSPDQIITAATISLKCDLELLPVDHKVSTKNLGINFSPSSLHTPSNVHRITEEQLRQLPQGTVLYSINWTRAVVGTDPIDLDTRNGFLAWGFRPHQLNQTQDQHSPEVVLGERLARKYSAANNRSNHLPEIDSHLIRGESQDAGEALENEIFSLRSDQLTLKMYAIYEASNLIVRQNFDRRINAERINQSTQVLFALKEIIEGNLSPQMRRNALLAFFLFARANSAQPRTTPYVANILGREAMSLMLNLYKNRFLPDDLRHLVWQELALAYRLVSQQPEITSLELALIASFNLGDFTPANQLPIE